MNRLWGILAAGILLSLSFVSGVQAQNVNTFCSSTATPPYVWTPCPGSGGGGGGNVNVTQWDTTALGVPTAYGTAPTTGNYIGVNAFVTNGLTISGTVSSNIAQIAGNNVASGLTNGVMPIDVLTSSNNLYTALTAASPGLAATACTTNSYSTGATVPIGLDLNGAMCVDPGQFAITLGSASPAASIPFVNTINVTPTNCSGTITTGATAQNAFAAQAALHGFTIANIDSTAGSGEPLWISFTTTAAPSTAASYPLAAPTVTTFAGLSTYSSPTSFGMNTALSVVGATTGHKYSCTYW